MNNKLLYLVSLQCDFSTKLSIRQCNRYLHNKIKMYNFDTIYMVRPSSFFGDDDILYDVYKTIHRAMYNYIIYMHKAMAKINHDVKINNKKTKNICDRIYIGEIDEKNLADLGKKRLMKIKEYLDNYQYKCIKMGKCELDQTWITLEEFELK